MLAAIPPRPDYETWMRVSSAVFSETSAEAGCRLLNAWSPEERDGEYADKCRHRLKSVGIGTLVRMAKEHGYSPRRSAPAATPIRRIRRPALWITRPAGESKNDPEAERIAAELVKLHRGGFIENDADARFFATAIRLFHATAMVEATTK